MDCSLPGSSVHGIFQARVLERVAIAFSENNLITTLYIQNIQYSLKIMKEAKKQESMAHTHRRKGIEIVPEDQTLDLLEKDFRWTVLNMLKSTKN